MAINDLYELTDVQVLQSQTINNVYFYEQDLDFVTTNPTRAQSLVEAWIAQKIPYIVDLQIQDLVHTSVRCRNLFDPSDTYEALVSIPGNRPTVSLSYMPTFVALRADLATTNSAVRDGSKFYAGVPEEVVTDGVITDTSMLTFMGAAEAELEAAVDIGTVIQDPVFVPIVIKRVRSGSPGAYTYRLPETSVEAVVSRLAVVLFDVLVTSQVKRKIGVGI